MFVVPQRGFDCGGGGNHQPFFWVNIANLPPQKQVLIVLVGTINLFFGSTCLHAHHVRPQNLRNGHRAVLAAPLSGRFIEAWQYGHGSPYPR